MMAAIIKITQKLMMDECLSAPLKGFDYHEAKFIRVSVINMAPDAIKS